MSTDLVVQPEAGLLSSDEVLQPVMSLQLAKQRLKEFQEFVREYLREGEDYGTIPGTPKPTLYKPGADKLCELYGLSDSYEIVDKTEDFDAQPSLFDYTIKCVLTRIRTQLTVSTGMGSCNSYEGKYRWRDSQRKCPSCGKEAIIKGKEEYGGGWICFGKKGGCGAKFADDAPDIIEQAVGRIENEDIATLKNTILKMAKKRAKIDATLAATRSSGIFTQDIEDITSDAPVQTPKSSKKSAPPVGNVKCTECNAVGGHLPKCSKRKDQQAQPEAKPDNIICGQCGKMNGHESTCQYAVKEQAKPALTKAVVLILSIERLLKKADKEGKREPFIKLHVVNNANEEFDLYVWHKPPQDFFTQKVIDKNMLCEFSAGKRADGTAYYSLETIFELAGQGFVDNKPSQQATMPAYWKMGSHRV